MKEKGEMLDKERKRKESEERKRIRESNYRRRWLKMNRIGKENVWKYQKK